MKPRLLANENFPIPSVAVLREAGYDVLAAAENHQSRTDSEILSIAVAESRWIVTFDRDYGNLIFARNLPAPPALLFLRLRSYRPEGPGQVVLDLLLNVSSLNGQFVVIQEDSMRKRPLPAR